MEHNNWDEIQFFWDAEVLYVVNAPQNHVYNILMYEWEDGIVEEFYFDITTFFNSWLLFLSDKNLEPLNWESEIFVENSIIPSENKII